jgi:hypothetical protein
MPIQTALGTLPASDENGGAPFLLVKSSLGPIIVIALWERESGMALVSNRWKRLMALLMIMEA